MIIYECGGWVARMEVGVHVLSIIIDSATVLVGREDRLIYKLLGGVSRRGLIVL